MQQAGAIVRIGVIIVLPLSAMFDILLLYCSLLGVSFPCLDVNATRHVVPLVSHNAFIVCRVDYTCVRHL